MKVIQKKSDKQKMILLGVLGVGAIVALYTNVFSGSGPAPSSTPARVAQQEDLTPSQSAPGAATTQPRRSTAGRGTGEFRPRIPGNRPGEAAIDPTKVDPTLRLDLLAKVQNVALEGGARNIFQFGQAAPPPEKPKPLPNPGKIAINQPPQLPGPPPGPPPPPPPPPINLKYYGYTNVRGENRKKAFFLDGEDILMGWEGETIKSRYKVVHVGVNSVEVEDLQFKDKQTLPLEPDAIAS